MAQDMLTFVDVELSFNRRKIIDGVGFTIYPGADDQFEMMEEFQELAAEAKSAGLAVVLWSYPRGGNLSKDGETAIDVTAYAAHLAALLGAHIIKVKPPTEHLEQKEAKAAYEKAGVPTKTMADRIAAPPSSRVGALLRGCKSIAPQMNAHGLRGRR